MASQWKKITKKLKDLPADDASAQAQVDEIKRELTEGQTQTPESLAKGYLLARWGTYGEDLTLLDLQNECEEKELDEALVECLGKDGLEALLSKAQKRVTAYEQLIATSKDSDEPGWGLYGATEDMVRLQSGSSVSAYKEPAPKVMDREAFQKWCIKNGYEHSLQLHQKTMEAITKERLLKGEPEPDGVEAFWRWKIVLRK